MIGRRTARIPSPGRAGGAWPVLALLVLAAVVPSGVVLWFLSAAMSNQALAMRQRLSAVYSRALRASLERHRADWSEKSELLDRLQDLPPAEAFSKLVVEGGFLSAVVVGEDGNWAYPSPSVLLPLGDEPAGEGWLRARKLEARGDWEQAAEAYGALSGGGDANDAAMAAIARARCLARAGRRAHAARSLLDRLVDPRLDLARDRFGRLAAPAGLALGLSLAGDANSPTAAGLREALRQRATDYAGLAMPAGQRRLLLTLLADAPPDAFGGSPDAASRIGRLARAERIAGAFTAETLPLPDPNAVGRWTHPPEGPLVYVVRSANGRVIGLRELEALSIRVSGSPDGAGASASWSEHARVCWYDPQILPLQVPAERVLATARAGPLAPGLGVGAYLTDDDPFRVAIGRQRWAYAWSAAAGIGTIVLLVAGAGAFLTRQMRLTRLKNDLIATVSHELKTPLSSMRVLVDTLRQGRACDERQRREYLDLIARENERLSRLIDNFLTFSRMERNKRAFPIEPVAPRELVDLAVEAQGERWEVPSATLCVEVAEDLPPVLVDRDAMVTALLNLLDNAWKYTGREKRVVVRARRDKGEVVFEVADNGVGLTARSARRVFDRFYQVDRSLTRTAGGCGLGLSIVRFIVEGHGGRVWATGRPGEGSVFFLALGAVTDSRESEDG